MQNKLAKRSLIAAAALSLCGASAAEVAAAARSPAQFCELTGCPDAQAETVAACRHPLAAVRKALEDPTVKKRIEDTGSIVIGNTPEQFAEQIKAEFEVYKKVVASAHLKLE